MGDPISTGLVTHEDREFVVADVSRTAFDRFDAATGTSAMGRTTGYTCTAMVHALAAGLCREPGLSPPEVLGRSLDCFRFVIRYLEERGLRLRHTVEPVE